MHNVAFQKITLIGTGNLAWHLANAFSQQGISIQHIAGRSEKEAEKIAGEMNINSSSSLHAHIPDSDLVIFCVRDQAIREVAEMIYRPGMKLIHTSGATDSDQVNFGSNSFGVLWPMQTLVKGNEIDYKKMMICVTANDQQFQSELVELASSISDYVKVVTDEQRAVLHMAATWVNNFTNHMFHIADEILKENNLSFDVMLPMIADMAIKAGTANPSSLQTGPAKRGDIATIQKHLELLNTHPEWKELYRQLSQSIMNQFNKR